MIWPPKTGKTSAPTEPEMENRAARRWVSGVIRFSHSNPVAVMDPIPTPRRAEPAWRCVTPPDAHKMVQATPLQMKLKARRCFGLRRTVAKMAMPRMAAREP